MRTEIWEFHFSHRTHKSQIFWISQQGHQYFESHPPINPNPIPTSQTLNTFEIHINTSPIPSVPTELPQTQNFTDDGTIHNSFYLGISLPPCGGSERGYLLVIQTDAKSHHHQRKAASRTCVLLIPFSPLRMPFHHAVKVYKMLLWLYNLAWV